MAEEKTYNKIIVVDENNENPRAVTFDEAVKNNLIRRASRVFVMNELSQILIQQRSQFISKPLLLDNSAAGHVDEGEEYIDAAIRELHEELGIRAVAENFVPLSTVRETSFFAQIYKLSVDSDVQIIIDPEETEAYFWLSATEVDDLIVNAPEKLTPSLIEVWRELRDKILSS